MCCNKCHIGLAVTGHTRPVPDAQGGDILCCDRVDLCLSEVLDMLEWAAWMQTLVS